MTDETKLRKVTLYCDGACRGNPGVGGYGIILQCDDHVKELSGVASQTTNNRMELTAAIEGLSFLKERSSVKVVTDSQYLKRGMTEWMPVWLSKGWKTSGRKEVRNRDLWERLNQLCERHVVRWEWVPGHQGHALNERCDRLANEAIDRYLAGQEKSKKADG
jgi:ribonuclease HI